VSIKLTKDLITVTTPPTTVVTQYPATTSTSTAPARLTDVKYAYFSDSLYNGLLFDYAIQSPDSSGSATSFDELGNEITGYYLTFYTAIIGGFIPVSRSIPATDVIAPHPITTTYPAYSVATAVPTTTTQVIDCGWNASAISIGFFNTDGYASFSIQANSIGVVAGLNNTDTSAGSAYEAIKFGIKSSQGQYQVVESGVTKTALAAFADTSVLKIKISFGVVTYYVDDVLIYTSLATPDYLTSVLDVSFFASGDAIIAPTITQTYSATATGSASLYVSSYEIDGELQGSALATATATLTATIQETITATATASTLFYEIDSTIYSSATATAYSSLTASNYDDGGVTVNSAYLSGFSSLSLSHYEIDSVVYSSATATSFATLSTLIYEVDNTAYAGEGNATANATAELSLSSYEIGSTVYATAYASATGQITASSYEIDNTAYLFGIQTITGVGRMAALLINGINVAVPFFMPTVDAVVYQDDDSTAIVPFFMPTVSAYGGAAAVVPFLMPTVSAVVANFNSASATIPFFMPSASAVVLQENVITASVSFPMPTVSALGGATVSAPFLMPSVSAIVVQHNTLTASVAFPMPAVSGHGGSVVSVPFFMPTVSSSATTGTLVNATIPFFMPMVSATASPVATTANGITYCINTTNAALTRYTNFDFKKVIRFNNKYYGVKAIGIYLLEGATDNGTAIDSRFQTYGFNFDSRYQKYVECVWLEQNKDVLNVSVTVENNEVFTNYSYQSAFAGKRVKFGRGLRGIYWEFEFSNVNGGAFNVGASEFLVHEAGRKI
jgi:hypothetical protein